MTRTRRALQVLAALAALGLLILGVPIVLAALAGWPLPHAMPDPSAVTSALRNGWAPDGPFVLKALAVVCWLAWAQLAACVVVEFAAALRGRHSAARVPLAGWAQPLAARLVATLLVAGTVLTSVEAGATPARPALNAAVSPTLPTAQPRPVVVTSSSTTAAAGPLYVVQRHDTLWDLAAHHLGDPLRWRKLFDLNTNRSQPDGRHLVDPHWIYPGWTLEFPADATGVQAPMPAAATAPPARPVPTAPAPTPTTAPPVTATTIPAATSTAPPTSAATHPTVPATSPPVTPAPAPTNGSRPQQSPPPDGDAPAVRPDGHHRGVPITDIGLPLLAAGGMIAALDQARRLQQRRRQTGQRPPRPPTSAEPVERKARAVAADQAAEWVDTTLRYLAGQLTRRQAAPPPIVGVRAGELGVEVLLNPPDDRPPDGFDAIDDGHVWRLNSTLDLNDLAQVSDGMCAPCPALITVGNTPEGPVLLNLEHAGTLAVDGDPDRCAAFLAGAALELATAPWADTTRVLITGPLPAELDSLESVERILDPIGLADELQQSATATQDQLGDRPSTLAARVEATWSDSWQPTIVVTPAHGANPEALDRFARTADPHRSGLALLTTADVTGPTWRLTIDAAGVAILRPLAILLQCTVDASAVDNAAALLSTANTEPTEPTLDQEPIDEPGLDAAPPPEHPTAMGDADVRVSVLGTVEVDGWAKPTNRKKLTEIVAYLATHHDQPVPSDTLRCALWPLDDHGSDVAYSTFKQAMSRTRAALGDDAAGVKHLPEAEDGAYRLGSRVACDWSEFRHLTAAASGAPSGDAIGLLSQALKLIRGTPFDGVAPGTYTWAWSEQVVSEIEVAVTDAAERLAELALDAADTQTADWAARQGLKVVPAHEGLQRIRMRAAAQAGDGDAVDQAYRDARRAAQAIDPHDELSDDTVTLYQHLSAAVGTTRDRLAADAPARSLIDLRSGESGVVPWGDGGPADVSATGPADS